MATVLPLSRSTVICWAFMAVVACSIAPPATAPAMAPTVPALRESLTSEPMALPTALPKRIPSREISPSTATGRTSTTSPYSTFQTVCAPEDGKVWLDMPRLAQPVSVAAVTTAIVTAAKWLRAMRGRRSAMVCMAFSGVSQVVV